MVGLFKHREKIKKMGSEFWPSSPVSLLVSALWNPQTAPLCVLPGCLSAFIGEQVSVHSFTLTWNWDLTIAI